MNRVLWSYLVVIIGLLVMMCLPAKGWSASSCCDESSAECRSGQSVGDKGSCTGSNVCVQLASECPKTKQHPGVLCQCDAASSSMNVSPTDLSFTRKSQSKSFTVSNSGNVDLQIDIQESGDKAEFSVAAPRKCTTRAPHLTTEPEDNGGFSVRQATAIVPANGCIKFRVKFTPPKPGFYTDDLVINSNADEPPTEAFVGLSGNLAGK